MKFYVLLSDGAGTQKYQLGYNRTIDLGLNAGPLSYGDTPMLCISDEEVLIAMLTSVLSYDNYNFNLTLGIDIYCEDNVALYDVDTFNHLIIREVNLSFTYQKKDGSTNISFLEPGWK